MTDFPVPDDVHAGDLLWVPSARRVEQATITAFIRWLADTRGKDFADYRDLWQWSVTDTDGFWRAIWDYNDIVADGQPTRALARAEMPGAEWFPGVRLNYAENVLARERPGEIALYHQSETTPLTPVYWEDFAGQVRLLATRLREDFGVQPGDRVASWLPNVPEAVIAMLAATAVGAIWTSVSPDFGWRGTLDRLRQLEPAVLLCTGGYTYGGKDYDRSAELDEIVKGLPSLRRVIYRPFKEVPAPAGAMTWREALQGPPVSAADFRAHRGPFGMPLWILFSSGTTGLPKAITHGHGGILLEQLKLQRLNMDLRGGDTLFFYTTTGWMMWNFLVSAPLLDVKPLLYDGHPAYPQPDVLWRMADEASVTLFGASPAYVDMLTRKGVVPREKYRLDALRTVMCAGSPVSPETYAWFLRNVKRDLYLHVGSGGTDVCSGFTGGTPTLPTHAGEHTHRNLGVAAYAYDESGHPVTNQVGEMVITKPMPSMPVKFWGDDEAMTRYKASYFDTFPGVWRQGDFFSVTDRGGAYVLGRSDATLNRGGVRIGTAEIYAALAGVPGIDDGLVVSLDLPGGKFFMPLFVALTGDRKLDAALEDAIRARLRKEYTARHVPDKIIQVPSIPVTLTGKKLEVPVRRILTGTPPEQAVDVSAMADPAALDAFIDYARTQADYDLHP